MARTHGEEKHAKKGGGILYGLAMLACAGVFLVCAFLLVQRYWKDQQAANEFADLETLIEPQAAAPGATPAPEDNSEKFSRLYEKNKDFIGWIAIDGTNLSFPVMQRRDSPNFYLRHNFSGVYSVYGVPYLDGACTLAPAGRPQSNNLIVYGHNMKTGTIFGCLTGYKTAAYYAGHPQITFDTLYGDGTYEVYAAFAIDVVKDTSFAYNTYTDMDEKTFGAFVSEVKRRSDVDSGITPVYGDTLLTLSTCEYSSDNGRYVVCARKVD